MKRLNFDSQRLPPFLIGYLYDGYVGEREIVSTIISLAVKGKVHLQKVRGKHTVARIGGTHSRFEYENKLLSLIPDSLENPRKVMEKIRADPSVVRAFSDFFEKEYGCKGHSKEGNIIEFREPSPSEMGTGPDLTDSWVNVSIPNSFADILPNLTEKERVSLNELIDYLNSHPPFNPEDLSREFLPYYIAAGEDSFWLKVFGASCKKGRPINKSLIVYQEGSTYRLEI